MPDFDPTLLGLSGLVGISSRYFLWRQQTVTQNNTFEGIQELPDGVTWLDVQSFRAVTAICDTFVPSLKSEDVTSEALSECFSGMYSDLGRLLHDDIETLRSTPEGQAFLRRGAMDAGTHHQVAKILQSALLPGSQQELFIVFSLLQTSLGCFILTGFPAPFEHLSLPQRTTALRRLRDSWLQPLRAVYQTFRRLTTGVFLAYAERGVTNPSWDLLSYHPKLSSAKSLSDPPQSMHSKLPMLPLPVFSPTEIDPTWRLEADVVIVGSGAGGGVMAHELVKAGLSVVVLEKGGYFRAGDTFQQWGETEAMAHTLERGGVLATKDGSIMVLAGSCVGGGTTINWSASFDLPEHVRKEWADLGLNKFAPNGEYVEAYAAINQLTNVNDKFSYRPRSTDESDREGHNDDPNFAVNEVNHHLWAAAKASGLQPERISRNVKGCVDCGNCLFGCPYGAKQSTLTALLEPLQTELLKRDGCAPPSSSSSSSCSAEAKPRRGRLTVIPHCFAERILQENGSAVGVAGVVSEFDEEDTGPFRKPPLRNVKLVVTAKVVVGSAGALHTPALLLRSGLKNRKIGKHLTLHPVVAAATKLSDPKEGQLGGYRGVGMGVVVKNVEREEDKGWGSAIETPPFHLSIFGAGYFWDSGLQLKAGALSFSKFCPFLAISRDHSRESNCVELDGRSGEPVANYVVTKEDEKNLIHTLIQECRLLRAAGAPMLIVLHEHFPPYIPDSSLTPDEENECFEEWLRAVEREGIVVSKTQLFSAHQMSSCRMASTPDEGVVTPDCECWELKNLFLADASVFPTSLGVNPMVTVEALSYMTSKVIIERLNVKRNVNLDPSGW